VFSKRHVLSLELAYQGTARAFAKAYHVAGNLLLGPVVFGALLASLIKDRARRSLGQQAGEYHG